MRAKQIAIGAAAFVLSHAVQIVAAHGDEDTVESMDMSMANSSQPTTQPAKDEIVSYFAYGTNTNWMIAHAAVLVLAWVFVLPLGKH